ncbi:putative Mg2+ transporter-C (MgtC) family protein [Paenibacillus sp. UNCCL117]|uniref:MgtC/SapB family protein n=1 Tax=unclassified Paenibacillus TaxID=185978 RepID=UPI00088EF501|nr:MULTISPECIES: MgtC/SapB family protein [unclassified Paenibacillus]SDD02892.1 putative Mg2+ transporter-C (MgtC) family protein [Paenibacillus sp. cl123]SFW32404.1 putative Mg2+ transporter-C (MgtC) family protein [Paenibacillus sp. UNCCL117]
MTAGSSVWVISHTDLIIRMMVAAVLGGLVGMEREWNNHAAGFRTHILVCLGSATIMLLSIYGFSQFVNEPNVRTDPARLAAQVISGIGFLGAGAILRNGSAISGLTTAASVWVVASIGLCVGAGFFVLAVVCTVITLISLLILNKWEKHLLRSRRYHEIGVQVADHPEALGAIASILGREGIQIRSVKLVSDLEMRSSHEARPTLQLTFKLRAHDRSKLLGALGEIQRLDYVLSTDSAWGDALKQTQAGHSPFAS